MKGIGSPAISVVSSPESAGGLPYVWVDDASAIQEAVRYFVRLGHRRIARVGGIPTLSHTMTRDRAFRAIVAEAGLTGAVILDTDYSGEGGSRATRSLLTQPEPPTAIIYDNDVMAVAGLGVASELGVSVPHDVSLLAWDDSPLCEITHPPLSAMKRDVTVLGALAAEMLLTLVADGHVADHQGPSPALFPRATTAAPPSA